MPFKRPLYTQSTMDVKEHLIYKTHFLAKMSGIGTHIQFQALIVTLAISKRYQTGI